jgi:hypothetical protein
MTLSGSRMTFLLLLASLGLVALGFWYLTGLSTRWFMVAIRDHFQAFFRQIIYFFYGMF